MTARAWGLLGSAALHVTAAAVWLRDPEPLVNGSQAAEPNVVTLRLVAAATPVRSVEARVQPVVKTVRLTPAPPVTLAVTEAVTIAAAAAPLETAAALSAPPLAPAPPTAPAERAEPDYRAATPPDRACTERHMARLYPPLLRERGIEGQVLLRVRVDEHGHAAEVVVQGGSGWRLLDEAARRLTQDCTFAPARRGAQALASWVEYPVRFALNGATP